MATKTEKVIGLWLDRTGDPSDPKWIVSRDRVDEGGAAETTDTIDVFDEDDYESARDVALALGRKDGLRVVESGEHGAWTTIYSPSDED
jgi:hypothetical protein